MARTKKQKEDEEEKRRSKRRRKKIKKSIRGITTMERFQTRDFLIDIGAIKKRGRGRTV